MKAKKYIILLLVLFTTPIVISGQSEVRRNNRDRIGTQRGETQSEVLLDSRGRIVPPGIPRGATHEGAFALALKDPNIYIGVFEYPDVEKKLSSGEYFGEYLFSLPNFMEAMNKFRPLIFVKSIKGKFDEPIIWYSTIPPFMLGEGSPPSSNSSVTILRGSKCILAVKKTTKEEIIGRYGEEMKKYSYINENTFFDVLWYGYGALYLKLPEERVPSANQEQRSRRYGLDGTEVRKGLVKVNDSMIDDLEAIVKMMPSIEKAAKDPNGTEALTKMSLSLKNDLAKSILEKVTEEKEETPGAGGRGFITNRK